MNGYQREEEHELVTCWTGEFRKWGGWREGKGRYQPFLFLRLCVICIGEEKICPEHDTRQIKGDKYQQNWRVTE